MSSPDNCTFTFEKPLRLFSGMSSTPSKANGSPLFSANLPSRETPFATKSAKAGNILFIPNGHRIEVKLPQSTNPPTTQWTWSTTKEKEDKITKSKRENPEKKVASPLLEAKELPVAFTNPHSATAALPGTVAAEGNDKQGKESTQGSVTREGETAGTRSDLPSTSAPRSLPPLFGNAPPMATTSASQPTPGIGSTLNSTAAYKINFELTLPESLSLPESPPRSLSNSLLFEEVFKIQELDRKTHRCLSLNAQDVQCKSMVSRKHSLNIKLLEKSLQDEYGIFSWQIRQIESLATSNLCETHTKQSAKLAKEWIRLAKLTKPARKYWLDQQSSTLEEHQTLRERNAEFAAAEVRRILAQDESARRVEKEKTKLYNDSQKKLTWLRTKVETIETEGIPAEELNKPIRKRFLEYYEEIFALEQQIKDLTDEIPSLKEARDSIDLAHQAETQRYSLEAMDARSLHKESQNEIEALRKDLSALTSQVGELTTENCSLKKGQEASKGALVTERERGQQELQDAKHLYEDSQRTVEALRKDLSALASKVGEMATENSSLKEDIETVEDVLLEERKRGQQDLQHARDLYESSQRDLEALRKEVDTLNSCISELTTKESSLTDSLDSTQDALIKEKAHSRELEIRLEELRIKPQHSPETKLEKYLREELDKSQRQVLQQQKDFEKLRDDHVRLQITNASLETQVKQVEAVKEELNRASNKKVQELTERNSDLSTQLHHTRAQFEQLKAGLTAMERENGGEASKSKFSLRDIYRRPKHEASRLLTPPAD
ncbi:hypothetical protein SLS60_006442 [Paraconiothyrium brasiliense]|uniref:Uncharacterized protein n=1 Tax=Paraconiothyrium brasiliense TaxID=300254 RepID=A0ABR3RC71_9PLEO